MTTRKNGRLGWAAIGVFWLGVGCAIGPSPHPEQPKVKDRASHGDATAAVPSGDNTFPGAAEDRDQDQVKDPEPRPMACDSGPDPLDAVAPEAASPDGEATGGEAEAGPPPCPDSGPAQTDLQGEAEGETVPETW
jgi:hypothetical protein